MPDILAYPIAICALPGIAIGVLWKFVIQPRRELDSQREDD